LRRAPFAPRLVCAAHRLRRAARIVCAVHSLTAPFAPFAPRAAFAARLAATSLPHVAAPLLSRCLRRASRPVAALLSLFFM